MTSRNAFVIYVSVALLAAVAGYVQQWFIVLSVTSLAASLDVARRAQVAAANQDTRLSSLEASVKKLSDSLQTTSNNVAMIAGVRK